MLSSLFDTFRRGPAQHGGCRWDRGLMALDADRGLGTYTPRVEVLPRSEAGLVTFLSARPHVPGKGPREVDRTLLVNKLDVKISSNRRACAR